MSTSSGLIFSFFSSKARAEEAATETVGTETEVETDPTDAEAEAKGTVLGMEEGDSVRAEVTVRSVTSCGWFGWFVVGLGASSYFLCWIS